jgi:hypothetical protein
VLANENENAMPHAHASHGHLCIGSQTARAELISSETKKDPSGWS